MITYLFLYLTKNIIFFLQLRRIEIKHDRNISDDFFSKD
jgi:hypothetical protein